MNKETVATILGVASLSLLKSKGSAGILITPNDLQELKSTEIEVQFDFSTDPDEYTSPWMVIDSFPEELMKLSNDWSSTYTNLTMDYVIQDQQQWLLRFDDFLYCDFGDAGDIANAICNESEYILRILYHMQVLHYLKSIEIIEDQWPQYNDNPNDREIELTINITLKFCDEETIKEIANTIGLLIRILYFSDYSVGNIIIDPNNKLSEKAKYVFRNKPKSELRRF